MHWQVRRIIDALRWIAADPDTQCGMTVNPNDEMATELGDAFDSLVGREPDELSPALREVAGTIISILDHHAGSLDFWQRQALHDHPEWAEARALARAYFAAGDPRFASDDAGR